MTRQRGDGLVVVRLEDPRRPGGPAKVVGVFCGAGATIDIAKAAYRDRDGSLPDDIRVWRGYEGAKLGDKVSLVTMVASKDSNTESDSSERYPELAKMRAVREESATLSRFVDWLDEHGIFLCETNTETRRRFGGEYERISDSNERLFARYFEIDLNKIETERRALLDEQRELNAPKHAPKRAKRALAKLGYVECICVKSSGMDDWYTVERAEHDGRRWLEPFKEGGVSGHMFMYSGRIADADVEGDGDEMLSIAKAIEERASFSAKRCAVRVSGDTVALWSPRNSRNPGHIPLSAADKLAASIRAVVITKDPSP